MKRRSPLLWILIFALCSGACKGQHSMDEFPPEVRSALLSPTADPKDFPPHPGTLSHYRGNRLVETVPASTVPDDVKFDYRRDAQGRITSRTPIVKSVGWFYKADGTEAKEDEPSDRGSITLYDDKGNVVRTIHSGGMYH
jgi:hypothetical protein